MDAIGLLQEVALRDGVGGRIVEVLEEASVIIGKGADSMEEDFSDEAISSGDSSSSCLSYSSLEIS